jgi:Zn-dependent membrane protease YugP
MENWFLYLIIPAILSIWAQARVTGAFRRYSQVRATSGLTGAQAAREIMDAAQIHDVDIVQINGVLGDHYDPTQKRLCLSNETYNSPSVAALGIAAHETGHAIQHARAYAPLQWRMTIVPVTQFASQLLPFVFIGGLWFHIFGLLKLGVLVYAVLMVFQLITLPVEYDASRRAKIILGQLGIIQPGAEAAGVNAVLDAAALTYLAAFIAALGNLLWLLSLTNRRR